MKRFLLSAMLAASLVVSSAASAANSAAAKSFIDTVATQVLALVKDTNLSKGDKQEKIEALFSDKVDIDFVAKFVLGKHWRTATPQQQQDYVAAYKPFILKNYAGKLTKYSGQTYTLKNARAEGEQTVVTMEINDPNGQSVNVDYHLKGEGSFKIVDIAVEGVSLLTTQRSEFNGIVENKGVDGLITALKNQVAGKK
ncbi:MAG: MlaC/ttg2D family ABC transporter substrate-binding protein [Rickettsiales bacterium]